MVDTEKLDEENARDAARLRTLVAAVTEELLEKRGRMGLDDDRDWLKEAMGQIVDLIHFEAFEPGDGAYKHQKGLALDGVAEIIARLEIWVVERRLLHDEE